MGVYEFIKSFDEETIYRLADFGLLRGTVLRDIDVYEFYQNEVCKCESRMQARTNTAENYNISEELVSKIIQSMR